MAGKSKIRTAHSYRLFIMVSLVMAALHQVQAQELPPRPVQMNTVQHLGFGVFYQGAGGGSVTIDAAGGRSAGGSVVLLGGVHTVAQFNIVANPGTIISFLKPVSILSDGNGHSMTLSIDATSPLIPFVTTNPYPVPTPVYVGGILTVGPPASNPPGSYSGSFEIILVLE